jgi:peptide-methionine (S)-S-oxide reductase
MRRAWLMVVMLMAGAGCGNTNASEAAAGPARSDLPRTSETVPDGLAVATFAGGCFWCMEPPFDALDGVISTTSGYAGGHVANPTYEQVTAGTTGHAEVVQVLYDPARVGYDELLRVFWRNIDPLTPNAQFCDRGSQYRSGIFVHDEEQKRMALTSKRALEQSGRFDRPIVTEITEFTNFYPAEDYHQDYYLKNPRRYKFYRYGCGRDRRLAELWGEG